MNSFVIGGTEFGVDAEESSISLDPASPGKVSLQLEVRGDPTVFEALTADENAEWSWALYPPHLYVHGLEIPDSALATSSKVSLQDTDDVEAAIYLMEHNLIFGSSLVVRPGSVEISGSVDLMGEEKTFRMSFKSVGA